MKNGIIYTFFFSSLVLLLFVVYLRFFRNEATNNIVPFELNPTIISVNRNIVNVGKVHQRDLAKGEFFIKNIGQNELIISEIEVSCSCSSVATINEAIQPNDSTKIVVQYNKKINGYFFSDVLVHGNFSGSPKILSFEGFYLGEK